jgi:hypothetical protein
MGISDKIPAVPWNRKLSEFRFEPFCKKKLRISFCGTKIEGTLGIPFQTLPGRENNWNFVTCFKNRKNFWNLV